MTDTRSLSRVEEYVRGQLELRYGQPFHSEDLALVHGGRHEFDAVSEDRTIVGQIKSHKGTTAGGRANIGGLHAAAEELFWLGQVAAGKRLLVVTDSDFRSRLTSKVGASLPPGFEIEFVKLDQEHRRIVENVNLKSSQEQRGVARPPPV